MRSTALVVLFALSACVRAGFQPADATVDRSGEQPASVDFALDLPSGDLLSDADGSLPPLTLWQRTIGGGGSDACKAVLVDSTGRVYVAGVFESSLTIDGATLTGTGSWTGLIASFDAAGSHLWSRAIDATNGASLSGLAEAPGGDVVTGGYFTSSTTIVPGQALYSTGALDGLVARYTANGTASWATGFGGSGWDAVFDVAVSSNGELYTTGYFWTTLTAGSIKLTSAGEWDGFLMKHDSAGNPAWARRWGGTAGDVGDYVLTDPAGNVYLCGHYQGSTELGGKQLASKGDLDFLLASFTASGSTRWVHSFGGVGGDRCRRLAMDGAGNIYAAGYFSDQVSLGGATLVSSGARDIAVASYTSDGVHRWSTRLGGAGDDVASAIATDGAGGVYVAGRFEGTADFGRQLTSAGGYDAVIVHLDGSGAPVQASPLGGKDHDWLSDASRGPNGEIWLCGTIGSLTVVNNEPYTDKGDLHLVRIEP